MFQERLLRPLSNCPICLETTILERGKTPFRFENMWPQFEGFSDLIKEWWKKVEVSGFARFNAASKLKYIKEKPKIRNMDFLGTSRRRSTIAWQLSILLI